MDAAEGAARVEAELFEAPALISKLLERGTGEVSTLVTALRANPPRAVVLVARGSSDCVATFARYVFELQNDVLCSLAAPSLVTRYGKGASLRDCLVVALSQSGQSEDLRAVVGKARRDGAKTLAIVNDEASPLARDSEFVLGVGAGVETFVPATKSVLLQMTAVARFSELWRNGAVDALSRLRSQVEFALSLDSQTKALAQTLSTSTSAAVIGRGLAYAAALETALKMKECAQFHAEGFSAADVMHGPVALARPGFSVLGIDIGGPSAGASDAALRRAAESGAQTLRTPSGLASDAGDVVNAIAATAFGQRVALALGVLRGVDASAPLGLSKVTRTS